MLVKRGLSGLSPKENREIPPLDYPKVYQIKQDYPELHISINGGIKSIDEMKTHLQYIDGVMVGREAYNNPFIVSQVDSELCEQHSAGLTRHQVAEMMLPYIEQHLKQGGRLNHVTRHIIGLFQGIPGSRGWRRYLSENAHKKDAGIEVVTTALTHIEL